MMKKSLGGLVFAGVLLTAAQASAQSTSDGLAQCAARTNAPGVYEVQNGSIVPGAGGTERGARNVADCLADLRGIQYGALANDVRVAATPAVLTEEACRRQRDNGIAASVIVGVATIAILGDSSAVVSGTIAGSGRSVARTGQRYRACLGAVSAGVSAIASNSVNTGPSCARRGNPFVGGTGYCRR